MKKGWALSIVVVGTIGIIAHIIQDAFINYPTNPLMSLQIFKFFTIQSNLIATVYFWILISLRMDYKNERFKRFIGAVVVYITITFVVFLFFLEPIYDPKGLDLIGSVSLHYINPLLVIAYFIYHRKQYALSVKYIWEWYVYPICYLIFLVGHGSITGDYLYPFFQVSTVGIIGLVVAIVILFLFFYILSYLVVKIVSLK